MPLHLLHHKSYHVYNADNIARVRRDEAAAAAKAAATAEAAAAEAASHRLQLLRARAAGEAEPLPPPSSPPPPPPIPTNDEGPRGTLKKTEAQRKLDVTINRTGLTDSDGHINLFPEPPPTVVKNAEAEKERLERERKWEANTFHNALGRPCDELRPWYSTAPGSAEKERGERETKMEEKRKDWADPLKMVQLGVRQLKEAEESRREWRRDREREVGAGDEAGFSGGDDGWDDTKRRGRHHRDRHHRRRSASPRQHDHEGSGTRERSESRRSRSRRRHRHHHHHHRHREKDDDDKRRLERLRAERERREEHERRKTQELLRKDRERDTPGWKPVEGGRYSKQFGIN